MTGPDFLKIGLIWLTAVALAGGLDVVVWVATKPGQELPDLLSRRDEWRAARARFVGRGALMMVVIAATTNVVAYFSPHTAGAAELVYFNLVLAMIWSLVIVARAILAMTGDRLRRLFRKPNGPPPLSLGGD